jgi:hypothetical protein
MTLELQFKEQPLNSTTLDETGSFTVLMLILLPTPIIIVANPQSTAAAKIAIK